MKFTVIYGFSGRYGHEWSSAFEAKRYAANMADEIEADSPEAAVAVIEEEYGKCADMYHDTATDSVYVIWAPDESDE